MSWKKIIKTLSSLKLAVVIIAYLCVVIAIGTIVESKFDSAAAKARVYDSVWMFMGMGALALSLIAVMVDRWPWKKRHTPFILAHIGILFIIVGSVLTLRWGLDGNMVVNIGESQKYVSTNEQQVVIYASFDGNRLSKVFEKDVNFLKSDLTKDPIVVDTGEGQFKFSEFRPYVIPSRQVSPTEDPQKGAGLRFQVSNGQFQHIDWLVQKKKETAAVQDLGPLRVRLGESSQNSEKRNEVVLTPNGSELNYKVFSKDQDKSVLSGIAKEGSDITLPWMGLKLKVLRYHPRADEHWDIQEREHPTPLTVPAVKFTYKKGDHSDDHWIVLNDTLRIFSNSTGYFVSYINKRVELGFDIKLKEFIKENYAGTMKAMAYKSIVEVPEKGEHEISMNEPLNWKGLTFYQASFQEDEFGKPVSSVFTVNYDPGRPLKYGGSLIMTLGIILLFYNRRQKAQSALVAGAVAPKKEKT